MNIGVFFGSNNPEHDVSIITGQLVISELKKLGHETTAVYIDKNGTWRSGAELSNLKFFANPQLETNLNKLPRINLCEFGSGKLTLKQNKFLGKTFNIELAFPSVHGNLGEDGTLQGVFELAGIPYVGCEVTPSAIAIDKIRTKRLLHSMGVPTPDFEVIDKTNWETNRHDLISTTVSKLGLPVVVKPPRLGSSIGVQKVSSEIELENAIEVALRYGSEVLIEKAIPNLKDLTCCVLGNQKLETSLIQESKFEDAVFSYNDKYLKDGGAQFGSSKSGIQIPAQISEELGNKIKQWSMQVFKGLGCTGIARVDFLLDQNSEQIYVIEVNPMPGTLYHHLWKESGVELKELVEKLTSLSIERHNEKKRYISSFSSEILAFARSKKLQLKGR